MRIEVYILGRFTGYPGGAKQRFAPGLMTVDEDYYRVVLEPKGLARRVRKIAPDARHSAQKGRGGVGPSRPSSRHKDAP